MAAVAAGRTSDKESTTSVRTRHRPFADLESLLKKDD